MVANEERIERLLDECKPVLANVINIKYKANFSYLVVSVETVSYIHLTLPTKRIVKIEVLCL